MEKIRIHVFVSGFVQGINFRYYTKDLAEKLGLKGWIRNLIDGRMEVVAEGGRNEIDGLITFLKQGPQGARIKNVEIKEEEYKGEFKSFDVVSDL